MEKNIDTGKLLRHCAKRMPNSLLNISAFEQLKAWNKQIESNSEPLSELFLSKDTPHWETLITEHEAHQHAWYDFIKNDISIDEIAQFLLENTYYPVFLHLLQAIKKTQFNQDSHRAVLENIYDEHEPEPHADLMRRMMAAVKSRAHNDLDLELYPSLIDRTLVFYYGFYCDHWHLVGSVFATERMGTRRVICMDQGLRRLGLNDHELAFTTIHSECDDHHASDWLERVIIPSVESRPHIRPLIASGIATCLETSKAYLDFLLDRVGHGLDSSGQQFTAELYKVH